MSPIPSGAARRTLSCAAREQCSHSMCTRGHVPSAELQKDTGTLTIHNTCTPNQLQIQRLSHKGYCWQYAHAKSPVHNLTALVFVHALRLSLCRHPGRVCKTLFPAHYALPLFLNCCKIIRAIERRGGVCSTRRKPGVSRWQRGGACSGCQPSSFSHPLRLWKRPHVPASESRSVRESQHVS